MTEVAGVLVDHLDEHFAKRDRAVPGAGAVTFGGGDVETRRRRPRTARRVRPRRAMRPTPPRRPAGRQPHRRNPRRGWCAEQKSRGTSCPAIRIRNASCSTSARCRSIPRSDIVDGSTDRRAKASASRPEHFISNVSRTERRHSTNVVRLGSPTFGPFCWRRVGIDEHVDAVGWCTIAAIIAPRGRDDSSRSAGPVGNYRQASRRRAPLRMGGRPHQAQPCSPTRSSAAAGSSSSNSICRSCARPSHAAVHRRPRTSVRGPAPAGSTRRSPRVGHRMVGERVGRRAATSAGARRLLRSAPALDQVDVEYGPGPSIPDRRDAAPP